MAQTAQPKKRTTIAPPPQHPVGPPLTSLSQVKPKSILDIAQNQERLKQKAKIADNLGLAFLAANIAISLREYLDYGFVENLTGWSMILACVTYFFTQSYALLQCGYVDDQNARKDWIKEK